MPDTAPGMMPNPHRVMAENDSLAANPNLDQLIRAGESAGQVAQCRIVISFEQMYVPADDAITILAGLIRSTETKISQKVKHVICAYQLVQVGVLAITRKRIFLDRRGGSCGKTVQLKAQVIEVVLGHGMNEEFIDDGLEVRQGADRR